MLRVKRVVKRVSFLTQRSQRVRRGRGEYVYRIQAPDEPQMRNQAEELQAKHGGFDLFATLRLTRCGGSWITREKQVNCVAYA